MAAGDLPVMAQLTMRHWLGAAPGVRSGVESQEEAKSTISQFYPKIISRERRVYYNE
jgi:hypothetical protein